MPFPWDPPNAECTKEEYESMFDVWVDDFGNHFPKSKYERIDKNKV